VVGGFGCSTGYDIYFTAGRVVECQLFRAMTIHGIPCAAADFGADGTYTECTLSAAYSRFGYTWPAQSRVVFSADGSGTITTATNPPDLTLFGRPLPSGSEVDFDARGNVKRLTHGNGVEYQGCQISDLDVSGGTLNPLTSERSDRCVELSVPAGAMSAPHAGRPGRR
jgi:hypothetical protein